MIASGAGFRPAPNMDQYLSVYPEAATDRTVIAALYPADDTTATIAATPVIAAAMPAEALAIAVVTATIPAAPAIPAGTPPLAAVPSLSRPIAPTTLRLGGRGGQRCEGKGSSPEQCKHLHAGYS